MGHGTGTTGAEKESQMSVMAMAFPILPGKTAAWRSWMDELNGPRHEGFVTSRAKAGVRERTFLQQTPTGVLVIVTLEGDDPAHSFSRMMRDTDPFTTWFLGRVGEIHGVDLSAPMDGISSELLVDLEAAPVHASPAAAR